MEKVGTCPSWPAKKKAQSVGDGWHPARGGSFGEAGGGGGLAGGGLLGGGGGFRGGLLGGGGLGGGGGGGGGGLGGGREGGEREGGAMEGGAAVGPGLESKMEGGKPCEGLVEPLGGVVEEELRDGCGWPAGPGEEGGREEDEEEVLVVLSVVLRIMASPVVPVVVGEEGMGRGGIGRREYKWMGKYKRGRQ
ncbi:unnamed protein product [Closterium sp. NIES-54]